MKSIVIIAALLALTLTPALTISLTPEFLTGFESGIFLRESNDIYEQYGCPEARPSGPLGNIKDMMMPIKMMTGFIQDKNVEQMISTIEVFVSSLAQLMAVFTNYEGGEFCSGLLFGSNGAQMLTNIAKTLMNIQ